MRSSWWRRVPSNNSVALAIVLLFSGSRCVPRDFSSLANCGDVTLLRAIFSSVARLARPSAWAAAQQFRDAAAVCRRTACLLLQMDAPPRPHSAPSCGVTLLEGQPGFRALLGRAAAAGGGGEQQFHSCVPQAGDLPPPPAQESRLLSERPLLHVDRSGKRKKLVPGEIRTRSVHLNQPRLATSRLF